MDLKKLTIVFAGIFGLFVFWGGTQVFKTRSALPYSASDSIFTYIMPKLSQYIPKFSLFDRTFVDHRKKLAPKSEETASTPAAPAPAVTPIRGGAPNATPAKTAAQKAADAPNDGSTLDFQNAMNNEDQANKGDKEKPEGKGDSANPNDAGGAAGVANNNGAPTDPNNPDKQSAENQINDWKLKLMSSPTREVMNEFVQAFEMEKVSRDVFYQVMGELVKEPNNDIQEITLYGLSQVKSYDSLSFLLKHKEDYYNSVGATYKQTLAEYERPDKLKLLSMALNSGDSTIILGALPMVSKVGSKLTSWSLDQSSQTPSPPPASDSAGRDDQRDQRGPAHRRPRSEIIQVIKILERLQDSKDPQVALAARDTLTEINFHPPSDSATVSLSDTKNREMEFFADQ